MACVHTFNEPEGNIVPNREIHDEPSKVEAEDGVVKVDGPDHVHVDLTPDAALETSDRLLHGSQEAAGQKRLGEQGLKGPIKKD